MISIMVDSGIIISSAPVDNYVLGSTVFDPVSGGYGYVNSDSVFKLVNPETGALLKSVKLPGFVSQAVIDSKDHMLIGMLTTVTYQDVLDSAGNIIPGYYGAPVYTNYVMSLSLSTGTIVSKKQIDLGDGAYVCSFYYDPDINGYVLLRADNKLITINPSTGAIIKTVNIGEIVSNIFYNPNNKTLIGMTSTYNPDRYYVTVFDPATGSMISRNEIVQLSGYYLCVFGYDAESDSYMLVDDKNELLFIDVSSGNVKKTFKLDVPMNDIKFWRK